MTDSSKHWQIQAIEPPDWFVVAVKRVAPGVAGQYSAQLLWQRGIQDLDQLAGFLDPNQYQPASPFQFGQEMDWAIARILRARDQGDAIAIWGDFDADGITATAVLWEGLGQFFSQQDTLIYYIPNRLTESHGLSHQGIDRLVPKGIRLLITCDTGSTNLAEIEYAHSLGMDVIVTDHHTLPEQRPAVTAILNPRYLPPDHPLASLSGVAVAYKLVEALYETLPAVPQKPLEYLLDLVAIGLIADLVELKGDCRYLAQRGIEQLQRQANSITTTRPGVAKLLEFCKRSGDRPTDISFGLGPRINAVSRIQGDAHFCVELLTSQDVHRCNALAEATELANARRKALQKDMMRQVIARVAQLDLSTTGVIVLADQQWETGVLGLVAGQIAQEYGRPTILLSWEETRIAEAVNGETVNGKNTALAVQPAAFQGSLARGSARSLNNIDLYQLVQDQKQLLHQFGGHPLAAGLSLPVENIPLFTEAINQRSRQSLDLAAPLSLPVDLVVFVQQLGKELFQELKLLEPYGMGNPVPRLLIQNCWFTKVENQKIKDYKGQKIQYIKTNFELWDDTVSQGFAGVWWGHYRDEIPQGRCDAVVELDSNNYKKRYEVRLIAVRSCQDMPVDQTDGAAHSIWILDWREIARQEALQASQKQNDVDRVDSSPLPTPLPQSTPALLMRHCPASWADFQVWFRRALHEHRPLAIAYPPPSKITPFDCWQQVVGIAKYLSRTGSLVTYQQLIEKLSISDRVLNLGLQTLPYLGFGVTRTNNTVRITQTSSSHALASDREFSEVRERFFVAIQEEQFQRQYFYQIPLPTLQAIASQATLNE